MLDNVPYAINGSFTLNLWMRRLPDSNTSGTTFQYLFSHTGVAAASTVSPNQARGSAGRGHALASEEEVQTAAAAAAAAAAAGICIPRRPGAPRLPRRAGDCHGCQ